ncbi:Bax inhibitor-1/YccA family protein [Pontiella agarivorans]|uniref:Bax inhibitor-1 family protein n=1 Tax=Pontiella agarivorans TaxID=3038953 RepID=A0ABU5MXC7_9BACT|nr:Bax inhibitor-1 family protein [Pontiella agarivorans]MDZ8118866.1 Bax inhibitor-1 family protein [Pontiella agarivorans]
MNQYAQQLSVSQSEPSERAAFIRRTYAHLAGALLLFAGLLAYLIPSPFGEQFTGWVLGSKFGWLGVLGGFTVLGWLARGLATSPASQSMQYLGLTLYAIMEAVIFVPIMYIAAYYSDPSVIPTAGVITLALFGGLTAVVFTTRKDFSFLRGALMVGGFAALGLIIAGTLFGFSMGIWFSAGMIGLAGAAILYDTSKIMLHYRTDQHVGAALELFASVAMLFYYVLRLLMDRR